MATSPSEAKVESLAGDAEPIFRVVEDQDARRGIRLERIYWQALRDISQVTRQKTGALVKSIVGEAPTLTNTTSLLRVYCLRWMMNTLDEARQLTDPARIVSLVRVSPSAAFALGLDKRIIAYNQSFLNFVQARFAYSQPAPINKDLRLALDVHLTDLATTLKANDNTPVVVGFVVGVGDRRLRGNLNAILAPVTEQNVILCYVLP
jgi:predicted DNA-binding ribbon-helix-helix protein